MKRTFFFLFASIIAFVARAQVNDDEILPSDRNHLTAVISFDVSIPGKWIAPSGSVKMFKPGSGVSVGADYMWLLGKNFFFEPGARLFYYRPISRGSDGRVWNARRGENQSEDA